ncbi:MAG: ribosome maturation factor RimP [Xanthomonadales bacterium]|nr:ribosome maturation factor RimP [Xanthomonadales bacterium]
MDKAQNIAQLVAGAVEDLGLLLWGVEYAPRARSSLVRLYIDHADREVTIEDCEAVSREVSALFEVEDPIRGQYTLEVSSPGLDRPFFRSEQLARFVGETLEVSLHAPIDGRRRLQGRLLDAEGERVALDLDGVRFEFDFGQAAKIRIRPDYEKILGQTGRDRAGGAIPGEHQ